MSDPIMLLGFGSLAEQSAALAAAADSDYGADMVAGLELARHRGAELVLLDRNPRVTAARSTLGGISLLTGQCKRLSWSETARFSLALLGMDVYTAAGLCRESELRDIEACTATAGVVGEVATRRNRVTTALFWQAAAHDPRTIPLRGAADSGGPSGSLEAALCRVEELRALGGGSKGKGRKRKGEEGETALERG